MQCSTPGDLEQPAEPATRGTRGTGHPSNRAADGTEFVLGGASAPPPLQLTSAVSGAQHVSAAVPAVVRASVRPTCDCSSVHYFECEHIRYQHFLGDLGTPILTIFEWR